MNIKYRQLKAFVLAAESGSFRAAAARLSVTQSSFSALIQALELDVGTQLFERTTRRLALTDAGARLHDRIRNPIADLEEAYGHVRNVGRGSAGVLSFGVLPSLAAGLATRHLALFQQRHPDVRVKLRERKHVELIDAVLEGHVEFGIGVLLRPVPELSYRHLTDDELLFVVPNGHPLASITPTWKSLERYPYIYVGNGNTEHALASEQVRTAAAYEVEHVATALAMVRQGLGVSVIPSSVLPAVNVEGLACLRVRGAASVRRIGVITKKDRQLGAAARAFVAQLMEERGEGRAEQRVAQSGGTGSRRAARAGRGRAA
ncbi:MAG: HTH-type transcriptional regulator GltC [Pseudomonadota bacterium]|jgi:DNA-binding transcriptional LysR family regulator